MDQAIAKFKDILSSNEYSYTKPRAIVFEALYSYGMQTINQLLERTNSIDRSSVYRTIDILEEIGVVHRVPQGFKYKIELSDTFLPHHHHIVCTLCGKHTDIEQASLENLLETIAQDNDYTLISHKVELQGLCATCKKRPS